MTAEQVKKAVIEIMIESTETEEEIQETTRLYEDMGLASVEAFVILGDLEEAFGIRIPASRLNKVRTVGDLCDIVIAILSE